MSQKKRNYPRMVSLSDYAALCGVHKTSIRDRVKHGSLEVVRDVTPSGRKRVLIDTDRFPPSRVQDGRGGKREGAGRNLKWGEPTMTIAVRCPVSKANELRAFIDDKLDEFLIQLEIRQSGPVVGEFNMLR